MAYDELDDINGGEGGAEGGDPEVKATREELFGLLLTFFREVWIHTSAAVHRYSPTAHPLALSVSL